MTVFALQMWAETEWKWGILAHRNEIQGWDGTKLNFSTGSIRIGIDNKQLDVLWAVSTCERRDEHRRG